MKSFIKTKHIRQLVFTNVAVILRNLLVVSILTATVYAYSQIDFKGFSQTENITDFTLNDQSVTRFLPVLISPSAVLGN